MKTIVASMAIVFLLVVNFPVQAFQAHPRAHKVKKHRTKGGSGKRHKLF